MTEGINDEIAAKLGVSASRLRYLASRGVIGPIPQDGCHVSSRFIEHVTNQLSKLRWLGVVRPENWARLLAEGLSYTVFPQSQKSMVDVVRPGNRIAFYLAGPSVFIAVAEISDRVQRVRHGSIVWPQGVYPYRVPMKPLVVLEPNQGVPARDMVGFLDFIRNKTHWEMYVRRALTLVSDHDFAALERAIGDARRRRRQ